MWVTEVARPTERGFAPRPALAAQMRLFSVAFPSCVHLPEGWRGPAPWARGAGRAAMLLGPDKDAAPVTHADKFYEPNARTVLMSYVGSLEGSPFARRLRRKLVADCEGWGEPLCAVVSAKFLEGVHDLLGAGFRLMRRSVFCLQPPGFGNERKSIADSITLGCIPVLFAPQADALLWPLQWAPFRDDSRVLVDGKALLRGELDLLATLSAIPPERVAAMQATIERKGHRLHYAQGDAADGRPGDGVEAVVRALAAANDPAAPWVVDAPCGDAEDLRRDVLATAVRARLERDGVRSCTDLVLRFGCEAPLLPASAVDAARGERPSQLTGADLCHESCGLCDEEGDDEEDDYAPEEL